MKKAVKNIFIILDKKEKKKFIQLVLFDVIISILDISFLALLLYVIHFYTDTHRVISKTYFPFSILNENPVLLIVLFFILFSIKNWFGFIVFRMQFRFVYAVASRLSKNNLQNYLAGSYNDYVTTDSSVHIRKIGQQPIEFGHYILGGLQQVISQSILILITISAILIYNPVLFPLLLLMLTPPVILTGFLIKRKLHSLRKTAKTINEKTLQHLQEAISGFIESNIYERTDFFTSRYYSFQSKFNDFLAGQQVIQNMPSRLIEVFAIFGLLVLVLINFFTSNSANIQLLTIGAFMAAAYKIIPGIVKILNSTGQIKTFGFVIDSLMQNQPAPVIEKEKNNILISSVQFAGISFSYNEKPVLNNFSAKINTGDFIGITGKSGKGKTTIINLLLGFITPCNGSILINNTPTNPDQLQLYWYKISYVKQQPFLIHDSILNNITLNENTYDVQQVDMILKITGLVELIKQYPEGINKIITENGKNISGGQRQRIAIARALYKNADILLLDEPFSELDRTSENCLLSHLKKLSQSGKIVALISHNKESLGFCNKIISLDES